MKLFCQTDVGLLLVVCDLVLNMVPSFYCYFHMKSWYHVSDKYPPFNSLCIELHNETYTNDKGWRTTLGLGITPLSGVFQEYSRPVYWTYNEAEDVSVFLFQIYSGSRWFVTATSLTREDAEKLTGDEINLYWVDYHCEHHHSLTN